MNFFGRLGLALMFVALTELLWAGFDIELEVLWEWFPWVFWLGIIFFVFGGDDD